MAINRRQLAVLALLTLVWGLNWPVMKIGVSGSAAHPGGYPPLTFRALSMLAGLPVLGLALWALKVPLRVERAHWPALARLALPNMIVWHVLIIVAVQALSSGRAAILGYTMPVFSALWGVAFFGDRLSWRQSAGVLAAALGVTLLLAHEFGKLAGAPLAALAMLLAAATWAYGTHLLRRTALPQATLTLVFWMTALTTVVVSLCALVFEASQWRWPAPHTAWAIAYNAVGVFGFAHAAWFFLARSMPPVASTLSVMLIPVLGVFSGAFWLGEALHWQDFTAMALMVMAIGAVLLPWPLLRRR
ncbi:MAG: DMT family transporter [Rubrivivax sp.]|nr:DMT family transporter [Rubrivivax sp.]